MKPAFYDLYLSSCTLCPHECHVNRCLGELGICGSGSEISAARAALHAWEEPCISGTRGSGTVFFAGCSLHCGFCQNAPISSGQTGAFISPDRLSDIFLELQDIGAHNINLVTPTHFMPHIVYAIRSAKRQGLKLPIVYNSSGYDSVDTLRMPDGLIDIYLPDLKFFSSTLSRSLCSAPDYFQKASAALTEMFSQVGEPIFSPDGILQKGMIVRHLMLPGHLFDTRKILTYLCDTFGNKIYISLMNQYTPPSVAKPGVPAHALRADHYEAMISFLMERGQENAYVQESGTCSDSFIPAFDLTGIAKPQQS
jgi:putative pyruvate formate lyase activating enzyme